MNACKACKLALVSAVREDIPQISTSEVILFDFFSLGAHLYGLPCVCEVPPVSLHYQVCASFPKFTSWCEVLASAADFMSVSESAEQGTGCRRAGLLTR